MALLQVVIQGPRHLPSEGFPPLTYNFQNPVLDPIKPSQGGRARQAVEGLFYAPAPGRNYYIQPIG